MKFFRFAALAALLGLGACDVGAALPFIQAGASVALQAADAAAPALCADIAKGNAPITANCVNGSGAVISILSILAQNGIKAHIAGDRLVLDKLPKGGWGPKLKHLRGL